MALSHSQCLVKVVIPLNLSILYKHKLKYISLGFYVVDQQKWMRKLKSILYKYKSKKSRMHTGCMQPPIPESVLLLNHPWFAVKANQSYKSCCDKSLQALHTWRPSILSRLTLSEPYPFNVFLLSVNNTEKFEHTL